MRLSRSRGVGKRNHGARALGALLGGSILLAACGSRVATAPPTTMPPPPQSLTNSQPFDPPFSISTSFKIDVATRVVTRMHLSLSDVRRELRAVRGSTIMNLAKPLDVTEDQLAGRCFQSLEMATNDLRSSGRLSATQAETENQYWKSVSWGSLISEISYWIVNSDG